MNYQWAYKNIPDDAEIQRLSEEINVNPILATLLLQRGVTTFDEARDFFRPDIEALHDPFLMQDMQKATKRLAKALDEKEKILIYGDYDVDGTTSVALAYGFLSTLTDQIDFYTPDRYKEGYGISIQGVEYAKAEGCGLLISLDCGIKAHEAIARAQELGIDCIICDHHLPGETLPPAYAVLDPKRKDCAYPYKELSGCGVGFKLLQGLCLQEEIPEHRLIGFIDLLAISIAADIVPITGENRTLAYYGLEKLSHNPSPGIQALKEVAGITGEIDIHSVVFRLGPRINAAGRIDHAREAIALLIEQDLEQAREKAFAINATNTERKNFDSSITEQAIQMIEENEVLRHAKSTVLFQPHWHKGVIGIVASRCIERFYRPTIILTESNGKATGSARSVKGFDVHEAISACEELLEQFGGHTHAAGLTLPIENVEAFQARFEEIVASTIAEEHLIPLLEIDAKLPIDWITDKFYNVLRQMEPFGPENMTPIFATDELMVEGRPRLLKNAHLKFRVRQQHSSKSVEAIAFNMPEYYELLATHQVPFKMAYSLQENNYRGIRSLQLFVRDIQFD